MNKKWSGVLIRIAVLILSVVLIWIFVGQPFKIYGTSMSSTLPDGKICFVNKLIYRFRSPARGDIIVFRTTETPPVYFLKRVLGLPGEVVEFREGKLYINREYIDEPYTRINPQWNMTSRQVREGTVYVAGDNRSMDMDQHLQTMVAYKNIIGRITLLK